MKQSICPKCGRAARSCGCGARIDQNLGRCMTPADFTRLIISQVATKYQISSERLMLAPTPSQSATREYQQRDYVARSELAWRLSKERKMDSSRILIVMNCHKHQLRRLLAHWERLQSDNQAVAA